MKQVILKIIENRALNADTFELKLSGDCGELRPGQFVEVALPGFYLRRPFGVADYTDGVLTLLYKVAGRGTEEMTKLCHGEKLDVLVGLGNGFCYDKYENPVLIGGGMGIAPLYYLAKALHDTGCTPTAVLGFRSCGEAFYIEEFKKYATVIVATDDGSLGVKGNVLDALVAANVDYDGYFSCGPMIMLKHLQAKSTEGEMSLEARMGCGFGACMGCSIETTNGYKRVCKEGPVFNAEELLC